MILKICFPIAVLTLLISCIDVVSKEISRERTNNPYVQRLIFKEETGMDEFYNLFGRVPFNSGQLDTTLNIGIYESVDHNIRLSLPAGWQILESERLIYTNITECSECFFTIIEHDPNVIDLNLKEYLDEVLGQLRSDSTHIDENLKVKSYPSLSFDNYEILGNLKENDQLIDFQSYIIIFEEKIFDITLSQIENENSELNKEIFELIFNSISIKGNSLFPKDIDLKYNVTHESN